MINGHMIWDTHIHIVPNVDDGARTIEEAVEMLRLEKQQGVDFAFATPHSTAFDQNSDWVHRAFEELEKAAYEARVDIELDLGCEMYCHPGNIDACIKKMKAGIYPSFGHYVLIELPTHGINTSDIVFCMEKLQNEDYTPIIAHAERYAIANKKVISELKGKGALIQINAYSITDMASADTRERATDFIQNKLVDFIGSDAHRLDHRPPVMEAGIKRLLKMVSEEYATTILAANPKARLLRDC